MIRKNLLILVLHFISISVFAGNKTYFGHIRDANTGEIMIGAVMAVKDHPQIGTVTNEYGFYSITITDESNTLPPFIITVIDTRRMFP